MSDAGSTDPSAFHTARKAGGKSASDGGARGASDAGANSASDAPDRASASGQTFSPALRWNFAAAREASAWVVPGNDCRQWLDEICRWDVELADLRIFVLPMSMADRSP